MRVWANMMEAGSRKGCRSLHIHYSGLSAPYRPGNLQLRLPNDVRSLVLYTEPLIMPYIRFAADTALPI